ncbi:hypothetical protein SUGI_1517790 [Cryptomeria japonica]|uniref:Uncharacterized protein n=1 Tax=Cryptomeria japonica TaxID=3369 RepID=A0AAD3NW91_CRYJA|nr:hypothetical protein SUGI_1517790 [Cryptomeria japonica]
MTSGEGRESTAIYPPSSLFFHPDFLLLIARGTDGTKNPGSIHESLVQLSFGEPGPIGPLCNGLCQSPIVYEFNGRPSNDKSQREYAAPRIIPSAANVATKLFIWKAPTKMGNSPTELLVPGELILAKVEDKEMVGGFGMVLTEPP